MITTNKNIYKLASIASCVCFLFTLPITFIWRIWGEKYKGENISEKKFIVFGLSENGEFVFLKRVIVNKEWVNHGDASTGSVYSYVTIKFDSI